MSDQWKPSLDALFEAALQFESAEERATFLENSCGGNSDLRQQIERLLASREQAGSAQDKPPTELGATLIHEISGQSHAASLEAGLSPATSHDKAALIGNVGQSVLKALGQTIDIPHVMLRDGAKDGRDPRVRPNSPQLPDRLSDSRYQLHGEIARGGMGAILKGRDNDLGRDLAIKVLLDQHRDKPEVIQRFVEEAQIGGQLQHPGIAPIYELGQFADKRPFFSMKLVKGETLLNLLANRQDPAVDRGRFIGIFEQICQTMAYAHSRGVIHRDLKPANIMVGAFGEVQVMDWGLAKVLVPGGGADEKDAQPRQQGQSIIETLRTKVGSEVPDASGTYGSHTQIGSVMGTPAYMPPEQALGEIDQLDERADVFGLGAILCEILTGQPPYVAEDGTRIFRMASRGKLDEAFSRLDACGADEDLVALTKHCLRPEPIDRPRNAGALAERVAGYLDSVESKLRAAEIERAAEAARADAEAAQADAERRRAEAETERANEAHKRRRTSLALAVSVLLLVGLVSGGWLYMERQEVNRQAAEADTQRRHAGDMRALAEQRDAERKAADNAREQAEAEKIRSLNMLADMQTERGLQAGREGDSATAALWFANAALLTPHDPDRERANHLRASSWMNEAMTPVALLKLPDGVDRKFEFQPNGPLLLTVSGTTFQIWDWRNETVLPWSESLSGVTDAVWSPTGTQLAVGFGTADVRILDPMTGDQLKQFQHSERVKVIEWSPDGTRLAVGNQRVAVWNVEGLPTQESEWLHPEVVFGIRFNRAGTRLVTACDDQHARVFALGAESDVAPLFPPIAHASSRRNWRCLPLFCDGDRKLATIHGAKALALWDAENGAVVEPGWPSKAAEVTSLSVSFDSRWLAITSITECQLLGVDGRVLNLKHPNQQDTISFSPDGKTLLTTCFDGISRLWSWSDMHLAVPKVGESVQIPQLVTQANGSFSPDGAQCAISGRGQIVIWERPGNAYVAGKIDWKGRAWLPRPSHNGRLVTPSARTTFPSVWSAQSIPLSVVHAVDGLPAGPPITLPAPLIDSCVCSDNRSVAAVCDTGAAGMLSIYNISSGSTLVDSLNLPARPMSLDARPGHLQLAVLCQDGTLQVIDSQSGIVKFAVAHDGWATIWAHARVAYSPDGATLVTATPNGLVFVRDAETGAPRFAPLAPVIEGGPFRAFSFSPDSRLLATAVCGTNQTQVWDLFTGQKVGAPMPHPGDNYGLWSVEFSSDGKRLLTGHKDGRIRIWDWQTGRLVATPMQNPDEVFDARFTPDGQYVVAAVKQSPLHVWDIATCKLAVATVSEIESSAGSRNCLCIAGDRVVVSANDRFTVLDLTALLTRLNQGLPALIRSLELVTNQRNQLGELVTLDQAEWSSRWEQQVASKQISEEDLASMARELEAAPSEARHAAIVARALNANRGERLMALRPNDSRLLVALVLEWSRTGNEVALKRALPQALSAVEAELEHRRRLEMSPSFESERANNRRMGLTSDALRRPLVQLLTLNAPQPQWHTLVPTEMRSESECPFTLQPDGSIFAGAKPAATDQYTITSRSPIRRITALKLDAIPDERLPEGGSGHNPGGNFHLTEVRASVRHVDGSTTSLGFGTSSSNYVRPIDIHTKLADGPWGAIDNNKSTRWDVYPKMSKPHWLTLQLRDPIELAPTDELTIELDFRDHRDDTKLGRFKLSVSNDEQVAETMLLREEIRGNSFAPQQMQAVLHLIQGQPAKTLAILAEPEHVRSEVPAGSGHENVVPPTQLVTWLLRAKAHQQLGETDAAQADFENILASQTIVLPRNLQGMFFDLATELGDQARHELEERLSAPSDVAGLRERGFELYKQGRLDEAVTALRRSLAVENLHAPTHNLIGSILTQQGRISEAQSEFQMATEIAPGFAPAFQNLGITLFMQGKFDEASAALRKATQLDPRVAATHGMLAESALRTGLPDEAIASLNTALEMDPQNARWTSLLAEVKRMQPLFDMLDQFVDGTLKANDSDQRLDLAQVCYYRKRFAASARFYAAALENDPQLANDPAKGNRYNAACAAALAGNGEGDAEKLDADERSRLRKQAFNWLRSELDAISRLFAAGTPSARQDLLVILKNWLRDTDLVSLRDPQQIAKLPEDEQAELKRLWSDLDAALMQEP